jgi:hypothetical protein
MTFKKYINEGLSIKKGFKYEVFGKDGIWELVDEERSNMGLWYRFKNIKTGETFVQHAKVVNNILTPYKRIA